MTVEIFTKDYCPYCRLAKSILRDHGVLYLEHKVSDNPELFDVMLERADGRHTVPQIFIGGVGIGGSDKLAMLDAQGRLKPMLERAAESRCPA